VNNDGIFKDSIDKPVYLIHLPEPIQYPFKLDYQNNNSN